MRSVIDAVAGGRYLRVVNYHNTPASVAAALHRELTGYRREFTGLTLAELDQFFVTGRWSSDGPALLPVFYEGFRNSVEVAAPACADVGLTGWFPVCTTFLTTPVAAQEVFARTHHIDLVAEELTGERLAMTLDEAGELAQSHVVFPHTGSHLGIADLATDDDFEREVVEPKRILDAATGQDAAAFVWLWGTPWGRHPRHDRAVVDAGYRYVFSNAMIQRVR